MLHDRIAYTLRGIAIVPSGRIPRLSEILSFQHGPHKAAFGQTTRPVCTRIILWLAASQRHVEIGPLIKADAIPQGQIFLQDKFTALCRDGDLVRLLNQGINYGELPAVDVGQAAHIRDREGHAVETRGAHLDTGRTGIK